MSTNMRNMNKKICVRKEGVQTRKNKWRHLVALELEEEKSGGESVWRFTD